MQNFNLNMNSLDKLNGSMQQIMALNQKTLRKFSYIEPGELTQIHDPKALLEKNMQVFIENGHSGLEYMHQLFNILGESWINVSNEAREKTKDMMQRTQSATSSAINKMSDMKSNTSPTKHASHSKKSASRSTLSQHRTSGNESPKSKMRTASFSDKKENAHKDA